MLNESFSRTRCLEQQHAIESQVCDPGIQRTCNFGFQKEEIKTHFLKTKEETCKKKQKYKSQELEIFCKRRLMRERMKDRQYKFYLLQSASGLQKRSEATGLKR